MSYLGSLVSAGLAAFIAFAPHGAQSQELRPVKIGVVRSTAASGVMIALDKGLFRKHGLDAKITYFDASQPIAVATMSGDLDFGATGVTGGLLNLAAKGGLRIIGGQAEAQPGYSSSNLVVSTKAYDAGLRSFKDIKGKRFGLTQLGSNNHFAAGLVAEKYGFKTKDVTFVPLQAFANVAAAIKGNSLDAGFLIPIYQKAMEQDGTGKLIGKAGDEVPHLLSASFVSRRTAGDKDLVAKFKDAYREGATLYTNVLLSRVKDRVVPVNDDTRELLEIISKHTNLSVQEIADGSLNYLDPEGRLWMDGLRAYVRWFKENNFVDPTADADAMVDKDIAVLK